MLLVVAVLYLSTAAGAFFAFTNYSGIGSFQWIGLENFARIVQNPAMIGALGNTFFLAFFSVVLQNLVGLGLAVAINRVLKTRYILRVLFFMPVVLSPLAVSYVWKFIFDYNGPLNAVLQAVGLGDGIRAWTGDPTWAIWTILVVVVWQQSGFAMVIYLAGLASVPIETEEAAGLDGANAWQRFWNVTVPGIRPSIAIATTLGTVGGLRLFDQIMALTGGGPAGATETLATQVYKQAFTLGNFGYGAALALLLAVLVTIFAVAQQRLTQGQQD